MPPYDMTFVKICDDFTKRFVTWEYSTSIPFSDEEVSSLRSAQLVQLLQNIFEEESSMPIEKLQAFEEKFQLKSTRNSEIKFWWLRIGLKARWCEKIDEALNWVVEIGRMKFVRPLYRDLYDWEVSRGRAIEVYEANKKSMMHVTAYTVGQDLKLITE